MSSNTFGLLSAVVLLILCIVVWIALFMATTLAVSFLKDYGFIEDTSELPIINQPSTGVPTMKFEFSDQGIGDKKPQATVQYVQPDADNLTIEYRLEDIAGSGFMMKLGLSTVWCQVDSYYPVQAATTTFEGVLFYQKCGKGE
jgi:hypothetical protein